jgi:hypothetical protein
MRKRIAIYEPDVNNNQKISNLTYGGRTSINIIEKDSASELMTLEGHEDFYEYLKGLGISKDRNAIFLSSVRHYYYDAEEMKSVKTIINLKELNQIKQVKSFLHSIHHTLPQKSNFIGCFVDNKKVNGFELRNNVSSSHNHISFDDIENSVTSSNPFLNMLYSLMDLKTNKFLSARSVSVMLEDYGFKVLDMKEINGLTYFHARKIKSAGN